MDPKKCHVEGCGKPAKARGMCMTHYYREYSKGKFPTKRTPADPPEATETKPDPPATPAPPKKPENMHENMQAPKKANGTKRVNVEFRGPDVELWEKLRDRAKRNRRDIRTEAICIIEAALTEPEEPEVYS